MNANDIIDQTLTDEQIENYENIARRDDWHRILVGSEIRLLVGDLKRARAVIRALKSSLPAETVNEAMVEDLTQTALETFDNVYDAEFLTTGITDNKPVAMRAAVESVIAALAHADDGWRPTHVHINSGRKERFLRIAKYKAASNEEWVECVVYDNCEGMMFVTSVGRWHNAFVALPAPPKDGRE